MATSPLTIFGWHNVEGTDGFASSPGVGTAGLTNQLEFLARFANVVSLIDAVEALEGGRSVPPRAVALTFDDGYRDNLDIAAPLLHHYGLTATFFLAPELLGGASPWWEELAWAMSHSRRTRVSWQGRALVLGDASSREESYGVVIREVKRVDEVERRCVVSALVAQLDPEDPAGEHRSLIMGWDEAQELHRQGFTIGSHSLRHSILARETAAAQFQDLLESRQALQDALGCPADLLAYPNGEIEDFDDTTIGAARQAGYRAAVTTIGGCNGRRTPLMALRRFVMYPEWGVTGFGVVPRHYARALRRRVRSEDRPGG
ncbi:MAG: polysaccharide deacetylase family protein [Actinomycetota bacterium]|nr:polysaccharide deacetylase family protein [Actinomycetota bacterium]